MPTSEQLAAIVVALAQAQPTSGIRGSRLRAPWFDFAAPLVSGINFAGVKNGHFENPPTCRGYVQAYPEAAGGRGHDRKQLATRTSNAAGLQDSPVEKTSTIGKGGGRKVSTQPQPQVIADKPNRWRLLPLGGTE
jgi:hypothetical protein